MSIATHISKLNVKLAGEAIYRSTLLCDVYLNFKERVQEVVN